MQTQIRHIDAMKKQSKLVAFGSLRTLILLALVPTGMTALQVHAQTQIAEAVIKGLPDAPAPQNASRADQSRRPAPVPLAQGNATLAGTVTDSDMAGIPGATVELLGEGGEFYKSGTTDEGGVFQFHGIPGGNYRLFVERKGFSQTITERLTVAEGEAVEAPPVRLTVASDATEITVRPTEVIAEEQIRAQEQQRVFGLFPNFYVSYVWDAAPMNAKQKYKLALHKMFDPMTFVEVSIAAGIQQAANTHSDFGQGAEGYAKRWGAQFANGRTGELLGRAVFASVFHQDPRYFYQGSGSTRSRAFHAIGSAFVARSDKGTTMPNYAYLLGNISSGALSNLYYPSNDRGAGLIFQNAAIGIGGRAMQNLIREFVTKQLTSHVPGSGKPAAGTQ
ncbi:carboxypeptidase-like regulatory domain-containing protein [Terriglobus roseus]|uniref:Carboxypeptidase regulatory-like domain-containing protein n=1 Tax=Terriglobus roseus TaxID=392734 RepID=A0A1G7QBD1_9BACT|nr:carboxypeptidase-like regulatory domain-containing protein [Terriglobus roseus]SDF95768.1 Carboxypeptidase regulatory-like domain-containing protein [Terriglobus roseus]